MQTVATDVHAKTADEFEIEGFKLSHKLWTRWEHGQYPVQAYEDAKGTRVFEFKGKFYESDRKLIRDIVGSAPRRGIRMNFASYFRVEDTKALNLKPKVWDVLNLRERGIQVESRRIQNPRKSAKRNSKDAKSFDQNLKEVTGTSENSEVKLGVDLQKRAHEVRKLLFAGFRGMMAQKNYDPEDVLQEVYRGILARNNGKAPWDESRSTFGFYVTMVCRCILLNYHRKQSRVLDREHAELDESTYGGAVAPAGPIEGTAEIAQESLEEWLKDPERGGETNEGELAIRLLPFVQAGHTRREISAALGVSEPVVGRGMAHLRKVAKAWAEEQGLSVRVRERRTRE